MMVDKKETALKELKERLHDAHRVHFDDSYYMRWLKARNFETKKAEAMLRNHLEWRRRHNVDAILRDFEPPEVIKRYATGGQWGLDREGAIVYFDPFGNCDIKGLLRSVRTSDLIRNKVWLMEEMYRQFNARTVKEGRPDNKMVVIFDLENLGMSHMYKPALDFLCDMTTMLEDHYPETLKTSLIINAPKLFSAIWAVIKPFLSDETRKKIHICDGNYTEVLQKHISPEELPAHYGGVTVDEGGDPRCSAVIKLGGSIPESFYFNKESITDLPSFTQTVVGQGSSFKVTFHIPEAGSCISWRFLTDQGDIGFGVYRRTGDNKQRTSGMEEIVTLTRVNSHLVMEEGRLEVVTCGEYILRFDNKYSWARSKKLQFHAEVIDC